MNQFFTIHENKLAQVLVAKHLKAMDGKPDVVKIARKVRTVYPKIK